MPQTTWRALSACGLLLLASSLAPSARAQTPSTYVVEPGDTLWQIAEKVGVDSATLLRLNELENGDEIFAGQTLRVAAPIAAPAPIPPKTYVVEPGDTLWGIASAHGVTVEALTAANSLENADQLATGQQLILPAGARLVPPLAAPTASPTAPAPPTPEPAIAQPVVSAPASRAKAILLPYTVQPGETVGALARQFGVTVEEVAQASGLDDPNRVGVGTVLRIPIPGREHVVQAGETLYGIAAAEKIDLGTLVDFNEIADPTRIRVGDVVRIPAPPVALAAASTHGGMPLPPPIPPLVSATPTPVATQAPVTQSTPVPTQPAAEPSKTPTAAPTARPAVTLPPGAPTDGLVGAALKQVGKAYVFGGSGPDSFDCSGFVWYVAKQVNKTVPRGIFGQFNAGQSVKREDLQPGDLVFFQNTYMPGLSHNGIYIGNNQFVHAGDEKSGVTISNMNTEYWATRFFGATRLN